MTVRGWKPGRPTRSPSEESPDSFGAAARSSLARTPERDPLERHRGVLEPRSVLLAVREVVHELELADELEVPREAEV
jgi:hypothetical protein